MATTNPLMQPFVVYATKGCKIDLWRFMEMEGCAGRHFPSHSWEFALANARRDCQVSAGAGPETESSPGAK
jgi:hypothetical protein